MNMLKIRLTLKSYVVDYRSFEVKAWEVMTSPNPLILQHHLSTWKELGFDTSKLKIESEGQSPSALQEIEENIQSALSLRQRMFPFQHISEVKEQLKT